MDQQNQNSNQPQPGTVHQPEGQSAAPSSPTPAQNSVPPEPSTGVNPPSSVVGAVQAKRKLPVKLIAIIAAAFVFLGGGAYAMYAMLVLPNDPDYVWSQIQADVKDLAYNALPDSAEDVPRYEFVSANGGASYEATVDINKPASVREMLQQAKLSGAIKDNRISASLDLILGGSPVGADVIAESTESDLQSLAFRLENPQNIAAYLNQLAPGFGDQLKSSLVALGGSWYALGAEELAQLNSGAGASAVCGDLGASGLLNNEQFYRDFYVAQEALVAALVGARDNDDSNGLFEREERDSYEQTRNDREMFLFTIELTEEEVAKAFEKFNTTLLKAVESNVPEQCKSIYDEPEEDENVEYSDTKLLIDLWYDKDRREIAEIEVGFDDADSESARIVIGEKNGDQRNFQLIGTDNGEEVVLNIETTKFDQWLNGDLGSDEMVAVISSESEIDGSTNKTDGTLTIRGLRDTYLSAMNFDLTSSETNQDGNTASLVFNAKFDETDNYGTPLNASMSFEYTDENGSVRAGGALNLNAEEIENGSRLIFEEANFDVNVQFGGANPYDFDVKLKATAGAEDINIPSNAKTFQQFIEDGAPLLQGLFF